MKLSQRQSAIHPARSDLAAPSEYA